MPIYNFSAGPSMIPAEVITEAQSAGFNFCDLGISAMEISHRSPQFEALAQEMAQDLRELLKIPEDYAVLFLQGGARTQFAMIPMNLLQNATHADYFDTGIWSQGAIEEAKRYAQVNIVSSSKSNHYRTIADSKDWQFSENAAYVHYTSNETINGLQFKAIPATDKPLVADMSSDILSYPLDINRFGLIYAAAQKNIGPAGLTLVIVKKNLVTAPLPFTPAILRYQTHIEHRSLYNTCPTFSWYVTSRVIKWLKRQGGVAAMAKINEHKAQKLYQAIDQSDFYYNHVDKNYRSAMNVPFHLQKPEFTQHFADSAAKAGLYGLIGHPKFGGLRASIYNAMPEAGINKLIEFMQDFAKKYQ